MPFDSSSSQGDRQDEYLMAKFQEDLVPVVRYRNRGRLQRLVQEGLTLKFPIPSIVIERVVGRVFMEMGEGGGGRIVDPPSGMSGSSGSGEPSGESGEPSGDSGESGGSGGSGESGESGGSGESGSGAPGPDVESGYSGDGQSGGSGESGSGGSGGSGDGSGGVDPCGTPACPPPKFEGYCQDPAGCADVLIVDDVADPLCGCFFQTFNCGCYQCVPNDPWCFGEIATLGCAYCCYEGIGIHFNGDPNDMDCSMPEGDEEIRERCLAWFDDPAHNQWHFPDCVVGTVQDMFDGCAGCVPGAPPSGDDEES